MRINVRVERRNPSKNSTVIQIEGPWLFVEERVIDFVTDRNLLLAMIAVMPMDDERLILTPVD